MVAPVQVPLSPELNCGVLRHACRVLLSARSILILAYEMGTWHRACEIAYRIVNVRDKIIYSPTPLPLPLGTCPSRPSPST